MALVEYKKDERGVGLITLNDPDNLNAMGEEMAGEFSELVDQINSDSDSLRVIIITGAGRAFSAGGNLAMLEKKKEYSGEKNRELMLKFYHSFLSILNLEVPLIAAINGHAIGAGLCVASACDMRITADGAKLGFTFTKLALHPGMGGTYFLPKVVGYAAAAELMLTGKVILSDEALRIGLVSQVVETEKVLEAANTLADEILSCGPLATRQLLKTLRDGQPTLETALEREASCQAVNYASDEFAEGVRAIIEKRKPKY